MFTKDIENPHFAWPFTSTNLQKYKYVCVSLLTASSVPVQDDLHQKQADGNRPEAGTTHLPSQSHLNINGTTALNDMLAMYTLVHVAGDWEVKS